MPCSLDFFKFENQPWPLSLAQMGHLRGTKADLVKCLSDASSQTVGQPSVYAIILDGANVVQILQPTAVRTFLRADDNKDELLKLLATKVRV